MKTVNIDHKLGLNKFFVDESNAHIELADNIDANEFYKLEIACPAGLYRKDENGFHFDYAGCLECGTCRAICGNTILKKMGVPKRHFWC